SSAMRFKIGPIGYFCVVSLTAANLAAAAETSRIADAAKNRDGAVVRALLKQKADVNARQLDGATAIHWAAYWDDVEEADLLIRAGANGNGVNDDGVTPLWLACHNGSAAFAERLLKAGADPSTALPTGETPLMTAAQTGKVDVVNLLIGKGVDVNAKEST